MTILVECKYCKKEAISSPCYPCSLLAVTVRMNKPSILEAIIRDEHIKQFMEQKSKERK